MEQEGESPAGAVAAQVGQKNAVEIFVNALEKSCRSARLYTYASGQNVINSIYENTVGALDRALSETDQIDLNIKPFEMIFERKAVYNNKEKKTSLSFALYQDGIRMMTFTKGFTKDELIDVIQVLATDFTKPEMMDQDLYCLFMEKSFEHLSVVGADTLAEIEKEQPAIKSEMADFVKRIQGTKTQAKVTAQRKLRADDLKIVEEFRLQPNQFSRSDEEVAKVIQSITASNGGRTKERETLERLLVMGFHFLLNDSDLEQRTIGRELVAKVTVNLLDAGFFDLVEPILLKIVSMQKERVEQSGEYQKILDGIFSCEQLPILQRLLQDSELQKPALKILLQAPPIGCRLMILLLGAHPWTLKFTGDFIMKHLPGSITWLTEEAVKKPDHESWEHLINLMSARPTQHFQKFLETLLGTAGPAVRNKILRQLSTIGTSESLKAFEVMLRSRDVRERMLAYDLLSAGRNKNSLRLLKHHLDSEDFLNASADEREAGYASILLIGGEAAYPWIETLWMLPGSGLFKKKAETERRLILLKALMKAQPTFIALILKKTPLETLSPELKEPIEKLIQSGRINGAVAKEGA